MATDIKTIQLNVQLAIFEQYKKADEQLKNLFGFSPGVPMLMSLSLAKDSYKDIVNDFAERIRTGVKQIKQTPTEELLNSRNPQTQSSNL